MLTNTDHTFFLSSAVINAVANASELNRFHPTLSRMLSKRGSSPTQRRGRCTTSSSPDVIYSFRSSIRAMTRTRASRNAHRFASTPFLPWPQKSVRDAAHPVRHSIDASKRLKGSHAARSSDRWLERRRFKVKPHFLHPAFSFPIQTYTLYDLFYSISISS